MRAAGEEGGEAEGQACRGPRLGEQRPAREHDLGRHGHQEQSQRRHLRPEQRPAEVEEGHGEERRQQGHDEGLGPHGLSEGQQERMAERILPVAHALGEDHELLLEEGQVGSGRWRGQRAGAKRLGDEAVDVLVVTDGGVAENESTHDPARDEEPDGRGRRQRIHSPGRSPEEADRRRRGSAARQRHHETDHGQAAESDEQGDLGQLLRQEVVHPVALRDRVTPVETPAGGVVAEDGEKCQGETAQAPHLGSACGGGRIGGGGRGFGHRRLGCRSGHEHAEGTPRRPEGSNRG